MNEPDTPIVSLSTHVFRRCSTCNATKSLSEFHRARGRSPNSRTRYRSQCRHCSQVSNRSASMKTGQGTYRYTAAPDAKREYMLRRFYGITLHDYNCLLVFQNHTCAICDKPEPGRRCLAVDHDHKTGAVRGLLCTRCNQALGFFRDDRHILNRAVEYLTRTPFRQIEGVQHSPSQRPPAPTNRLKNPSRSPRPLKPHPNHTSRRWQNRSSYTRLLTANNETHSISEWARMMGRQRAALQARLARGWTVAETLDLAPAPKNEYAGVTRLTVGGQTMSLKNWAHASGLTDRTIWKRRNRGWTNEQAVGLAPPPLRKRK